MSPACAGGGVHIGKGKARKPYEFGVKVSLAVTHRQGLMVGARSVTGNPYDGHTLAAQREQTTVLLQDIAAKPSTTIVDLGYRGADADVAPVQVIHRGNDKTLTATQRTWRMRRQAIEPAIRHAKADRRRDRCWLKGSEGDALHAVPCAAGSTSAGCWGPSLVRPPRPRPWPCNLWRCMPPSPLGRASGLWWGRLRG